MGHEQRVSRLRGRPADVLLGRPIPRPDVPANKSRQIHITAGRAYSEPRDGFRSVAVAEPSADNQGADAALRHRLACNRIPESPSVVVTKDVAGDDHRVERDRVVAGHSREWQGWASFVSGNRAFGAERRKRYERDVRASPRDLQLEDTAQRNLAEFAGIERPKEPDHRPLSGTVHVMPPCCRADRGGTSRLRTGSGNARQRRRQ